MNRISQNRVRRATIIVAAGKGTRIGELTCTRPKSTLKLNGLSIISRTCELILEVSEQIIIVAGKNALCLHEELSWIAEDKLVVVDTPELSEQGCSASMRAGLQALSSEILEVLIIEGDLVLTRDAVRKMLEAEGKIKIAVTPESEESEGKVFWNSESATYYIYESSRGETDVYRGKFVGFSSLSIELANRLESEIPAGSTVFCSDYIQTQLGAATQLVELSQAEVGEVDCPEDYEHVLESMTLNRLMISSSERQHSLFVENRPLQRFLTVGSAEDMILAQRYGFDGVWLDPSSGSLQKQLEVRNELSGGHYLLPTVCDLARLQLDSSELSVLVEYLTLHPVAGVCFSPFAEPQELVEEFIGRLERMTKQSGRPLTILFRVEEAGGSCIGRSNSLRPQAKSSTLTFAEIVQTRRPKSGLPVQADYPVGLLSPSFDFSLEECASMNYFLLLYQDIRPLSGGAFRRNLLKLSTLGFLASGDFGIGGDQ